MERMVLETMNRIGIPSVNRVVYFEDEFNNMIRNISNIKLTGGLFSNKNYLDYKPINFNTIDPKDIIGDAIEIRNGEIVVDVYDDKLDILKTALEEGYKPGMRYIASISRPRANGITVASDMRFICYDMVR